MEFKINRDYDKFNGTSLQGYVRTKFDNIKSIFGEPTNYDSFDEKVNAEWCIEFEDGKVATIYNYKTGCIPKGDYDWHIGSSNDDGIIVINRIKRLLGNIINYNCLREYNYEYS